MSSSFVTIDGNETGQCSSNLVDAVTSASISGDCARLAIRDLGYRGPLASIRSIVDRFHDIPRFGKGRDITVISSDNQDEWDDYKRGLLAWSAVGWALFGLWIAFLIFCRFHGHCGILSGKINLIIQKQQHGSSNSSSRSSGDTNEHPRRQIRIVRGIAFVSGLLVLIFSGLVIRKGFVSFNDTVQSVQDTLPTLIELCEEGSQGIGNYIDSVNETRQDVKEFLTNLTETCTNLTNNITSSDDNDEDLYNNITNLPANGTAVDDDDEPLLKRIHRRLQESPFSLENMLDLQEDFDDTKDDAEKLLDALDGVKESWMVAASCMVLFLDVFVVYFMALIVLLEFREESHTQNNNGGVVENSEHYFQLNRQLVHINNRVVLIVFLLVMVVMFLLSTICLLTSTLLGDFCVDTPDDQVLAILEINEYPVLPLAEWYIGGCQPPDIPDELLDTINEKLAPLARDVVEFVNIVKEQLQLSNNISESSNTDVSGGRLRLLEQQQLQDNLDFIEENCNLESMDLLLGLVPVLVEEIKSAIEVFIDMLWTFRCDRFNIIYAGLAYDSACDKGIQASAQIFVYLFLVCTFCMVMATVRAAWDNPILIKENDATYTTNKVPFVNVEDQELSREEEDDYDKNNNNNGAFEKSEKHQEQRIQNEGDINVMTEQEDDELRVLS